MNLYTGIARLLLTEPRRPRLERVDQVVELGFRVWPTDIDYMAHMNNARYFTAMELVRLALMSRSGLVKLSLGRGWKFANAAQKAVFFRGLELFDRYTVDGRVLYMDDRWLYLKQAVRRDGELCATGLFKAGIRDGRKNVSPRELTTMLGYEPPAGAMPPEIVEWEKVNAILVAEKKAEAGLEV